MVKPYTLWYMDDQESKKRAVIAFSLAGISLITFLVFLTLFF
jgi:hypothetical protein